MREMLRLIRLVAPFKGWMALSVALGFATVGSGIGLMATAALLIAMAALHPSVADLALPIVGVRFFGLSRGVFRYLERYVSHNTTFHILARLRVWFYQALEPLAPARLMQYRGGDLLARTVGDVETLQHFFIRVIAPTLTAVLVVAAVVSFLITIDPGLALVLSGSLLLAGLGVPVLAERLGRGLGREAVETQAELSVQLVDGIQGMSDLVAFGRESSQLEKVRRLNRRWAGVQERSSRVSGLCSSLETLLANLGMWAMLVLAIPLVSSGRLEGVLLPVLALIALASFEAVSPLPLAFQHLEGCLEAARRLFEIVDAGTRGRGDGPHPLPLPATGRGDSIPPLPEGEGRGEGSLERQQNGCPHPNPLPLRWERELGDSHCGGRGDSLRTQHSALSTQHSEHEDPGLRTQDSKPSAQHLHFVVRDLRFRYSPGEPWVLDGLSFDLREGQRLALVGPSGVGKSTLLHLLLRFWDYDEGHILLNGRELRDYSGEEIRSRVGVVSQRTHLFSGTIRQNLLLAKPEATEDELVKAAERAQLHRFIQALPDGYDSWIGEQGMQLSGGERQRLAIARALLKDPPLLLLDEPTANLDTVSERDVMRAILSLMEGRTTLLVTHRLVWLDEMDQILLPCT